MTVQDLINGALHLVGNLDHGQMPNADESEAALDALNAIASNWSTQHRKIFVIDHKQFPLTTGVGAYTMGPGGDFNTERPTKIQKAGLVYYRTTGDNELVGLRKPLLMVDSMDWAGIAEKGAEAQEPLKVWNDNGYPLVTLHLWPVPVCP